jgi:CheY-like chemotaxis protein
MRVLGVGDDAVWRTVVVKGPGKPRYDTVEARDGREALAICRSRGAISLLITDMMMPDLDGLGLLEHIRNTRS